MAIKRINLSFSLDRKDDLEVFNILSKQKYKTDYVIKAVLSYIRERDKGLDKETIKQAVKEAIEECGGIITGNSRNDDFTKAQLPNEIFDMFNNL
jgi:hypothetical protein